MEGGMSNMTRSYSEFRNANWTLAGSDTDTGALANVHEATLAVLMDIRSELQAIRRVAECHNVQRVPRILDTIAANTRKSKRPAKASRAA